MATLPFCTLPSPCKMYKKGVKIMKKQFSFVLSLVLIALLALSPLSGLADNIPVIGISQFGEHASLDNCRIGFIEGLTLAGLVEGKDFEIDYQNASFNDAMTAQIADNFASRKVALMCAIATPSAMACYNATEDNDIPVIFCAINDPVQAGLIDGNVTGTSDKLPVEAQLSLIRAMQPEAKTIGIIYSVSELNSVSTIADYEAKAPEFGFEIVSVGVTAQSEVTQAADTLISKKVDAFSNLTDNTVVGVLDSILEKTDAAGIPVYGSEVEQVKKGCVASAGIDYLALGRQTGAMAARVLKGECKASDIPYETISEYGIYINSATMASMSLTLPEDLAGKAIESATAE